MHQIDMQTLADEAKFNGFHVKVLLWCLLILIIDGYDIAVSASPCRPSCSRWA